MIIKAETWAAKLWEAALPRWSGREGQDRNYRRYVVHPAIESILVDRTSGENTRIIELGCGDGSFLENGAGMKILSSGGEYIGIDISGELIEKARANHRDSNVRFLTGSLTDSNITGTIEKNDAVWTCLISIFAIQEIPDLESTLKNAVKMMADGDSAVFVTVHPDFGLWLMEQSKMTVIDNLNVDTDSEDAQWQWVAEYPIVDEPREAFHLPYFHRSLDNYRRLFSKSGLRISEVVEFPDAERDLPQLKIQGLSPFKFFDGNLYWPRIGESPSSIAIIAEKAAADE